jgi:hypothetical protein
MMTPLWRLLIFKNNVATTDKEIYDMYNDPPLEIVYI